MCEGTHMLRHWALVLELEDLLKGGKRRHQPGYELRANAQGGGRSWQRTDKRRRGKKQNEWAARVREMEELLGEPQPAPKPPPKERKPRQPRAPRAPAGWVAGKVTPAGVHPNAPFRDWEVHDEPVVEYMNRAHWKFQTAFLMYDGYRVRADTMEEMDALIREKLAGKEAHYANVREEMRRHEEVEKANAEHQAERRRRMAREARQRRKARDQAALEQRRERKRSKAAMANGRMGRLLAELLQACGA